MVALAGLALIALAASLVVDRRLLGAALLALAAAFVTLDLLRARTPSSLVLYATGLLVLGELASFAAGLRAIDLLDTTIITRRSLYLLAVALGAATVATICELASRIAIGGGLAPATIGVGATIALLALVSAAARPRRTNPPSPAAAVNQRDHRRR
jgi:hypothetical protein